MIAAKNATLVHVKRRFHDRECKIKLIDFQTLHS